MEQTKIVKGGLFSFLRKVRTSSITSICHSITICFESLHFFHSKSQHPNWLCEDLSLVEPFLSILRPYIACESTLLSFHWTLKGRGKNFSDFLQWSSLPLSSPNNDDESVNITARLLTQAHIKNNNPWLHFKRTAPPAINFLSHIWGMQAPRMMQSCYLAAKNHTWLLLD